MISVAAFIADLYNTGLGQGVWISDCEAQGGVY